MQDYILEICADSAESAIAAEKGGATRLELCQNLIIGGTTPGPKLFEIVRHAVEIPVHVLIRPRFGDFCYSDYEMEQIKEEIKMFRELGADGVVIGVLSPDGSIDRERMERLLEERGEMSVTLHRAFDVCRDPLKSLQMAKDLGIQTILTSGQKDSCMEGADLLRELQKESQGGIQIQAGGGVTPENLETLFCQTGIRAWHMSAKTGIESRMKYRNPDVHMGIADISEYILFQTSEAKVRQAADILKRL